MAHDFIKDDLALNQRTGRISLQIVATLLGGTLLIAGFIARFILDVPEDTSSLLAMAATILLGAPLIWVAIQDLARGHMHMNELVALAVLAAFAKGWYFEAGSIAFFMIISVLIESRTALGAQASIESLIRITPTKATLVRRGRTAPAEATSAALPYAESSDFSGSGMIGGAMRSAEHDPHRPTHQEPGDPELETGTLTAALSHGERGANPAAAITHTSDAPTRSRASEQEVEAHTLRPGDVVRVRPGDNIPADGFVLTGQSTVNQANITGESLPVDKQIGDEVFGGTINMTGVMDLEVSKAGEDTTLGRVKELILEAERTKIPLARMIDRYAQWYTPTVLMLVFIVWFFTSQTDPDLAAKAAIAMLVIACPCPLILATPTAMVAALSAAARLGVLVKSVVNLEAARNLTAMVFDKTGTLTTGQLEVTRLTPAEGVEGADLLRAAAAAEAGSRHPVARAVTAVARKARMHLSEPEHFEEVAGKGVVTRFDGSEVLVGRGTWIAERVPALADEANRIITGDAASGLSVLLVVRDAQLLGWVGLADNTRPEAAASVDRLRDLGMKRIVMCTGDRESVAQRVAGQLHTDYMAEVLPQQKLQLVDELKAKGHRVAMVGDGVNDAPALAAGDIAIAMGAAGSDVAIHSASVVINNNNLNRIPFLIDLSRRTSAIIKQNLAIGGGFILLFLALSAAGYVEPWLAAVLHVVSSLIVIFNSARLVRAGEEIEHAEHRALREATARAPRPTSATPAAPPPPTRLTPATA